MIRRTFPILDGIGYRSERRIWDQGVESWDDFCNRDRVAGISEKRKRAYERELEIAEHELRSQTPSYFVQKLKPRDQWRLYEGFSNTACYLDIETDSLDPYRGKITAISLYNGSKIRTLVHGRDLVRKTLERELSKYGLLVTFYGTCFDLPFLRAHFPGLKLEIPHFDLCLTGRKIGLNGGLKRIEKKLGISRPLDIAKIDGLEAVRLWNRWEERGDSKALETLIRYNQEDTTNLRALAKVIYSRMKRLTMSSLPGGG